MVTLWSALAATLFAAGIVSDKHSTNDINGSHPTIGSDREARELYELEFRNAGGSPYWPTLLEEEKDKYRKRVGAPLYHRTEATKEHIKVTDEMVERGRLALIKASHPWRGFESQSDAVRFILEAALNGK